MGRAACAGFHSGVFSMAPSRNTFVFIFTAMLAAVFLIVTGLIGYQPPAHLSLDAATWRRGVWTGAVILPQVALGVVLLAAAGYVAVRVNRRLAHGR
jgi:quinol-cytochrome oxidoreductase complex cytochrome b subunit